MDSKKEFVGKLEVVFVDDTKAEDSVYRKGKKYFLGSTPLYPSNQGRGIDGCIRELVSIHKKGIKSYKLEK